jgi:hypothetical protein
MLKACKVDPETLTGTVPIVGKFEREPLNEVDPNAVAVVCPMFGGRIGWVPKGTAIVLGPALDAGAVYAVTVTPVIHPNHQFNPGWNVYAVRL